MFEICGAIDGVSRYFLVGNPVTDRSDPVEDRWRTLRRAAARWLSFRAFAAFDGHCVRSITSALQALCERHELADDFVPSERRHEVYAVAHGPAGFEQLLRLRQPFRNAVLASEAHALAHLVRHEDAGEFV